MRTDDTALLEELKGVLGGRKVYNQNCITAPLKAGPKLYRYKSANPEVDPVTSQAILAVYKNTKKRIENIEKIRSEYLIPGLIKFEYKVEGRYPPLDHQKIMYNACYYCSVSAIIADPGTCKTASYLWAIDQRIKDGKVKKALVITLSGLKRNVLEEMSVQVPHLKGVVLNGGAHANVVINKKYKMAKKNLDYDVYIANYESMFSIVTLFPDDFFDMIVLDEAHRIGNPSSRQTECIVDKFENAKYKVIVTGTLHANTVMSFYMPFRFLGADVVPYASYYDFRRRYMYATDAQGFIWKECAGSRYEVQKIVGQIAIAFKKEECLDLPDLIRERVYCELSAEQKVVYNEVAKDLLSEIKNMCSKCDKGPSPCQYACQEEIVVKSVLVKMTKLAQIACGFYTNTRIIVDKDGRETNDSNNIIFPENPKLDAMIGDILLNIPKGEKVIIWSSHIVALRMICERLDKAFGPGSYLTCWGDDDAYARGKQFEESSEDYLVANPAKGGVGLNLQYSHYQIFFSNSFSMIQRQQAEARQNRQGQTSKMTAFDVLADKTIDTYILKRLVGKEEMAVCLSEIANLVRKEV